MDAKLTLKLDKQVIDRAKDYAKSKHISVSAIVENYFKTITQPSNNKDKVTATPITDSLCGIISIPDNFDYKTDYYNHLDKKHK